jgi:hypothetical protein
MIPRGRLDIGWLDLAAGGAVLAPLSARPSSGGGESLVSGH